MIITILTDHSSHTITNSFYGIVNNLRNHKDVSCIQIASKGDHRNEDFFNGTKDPALYGVIVQEEIQYPDEDIWSRSELIDLESCEVILLRLPPPFTTPLMRMLEPVNHKLIINDPAGIEKTGNKGFLMNFDDYVAPMEICKTFDDIYDFYSKFECVLKPLNSYGGKGILRLRKNMVQGSNGTMSLDDFQQDYYENPVEYLAMKFLKNVSNGDKRIIVANGEILTSSLRYPGKGKWLCNVAQGGRDEISKVTAREVEIVKYISPKLKQEGIFYYGLDTIEDDDGQRLISEINTISPGGFTPAEMKSGLPITKRFCDLLINHCEKRI